MECYRWCREMLRLPCNAAGYLSWNGMLELRFFRQMLNGVPWKPAVKAPWLSSRRLDTAHHTCQTDAEIFLHPKILNICPAPHSRYNTLRCAAAPSRRDSCAGRPIPGFLFGGRA